MHLSECVPMVEQYTAIFVWFLSALSLSSVGMFCGYYCLGLKYCSSFCPFFFLYTTASQAGCPGAFKWSQSMGHTSGYTPFKSDLASHSHHSGRWLQCSTKALKTSSKDKVHVKLYSVAGVFFPSPFSWWPCSALSQSFRLQKIFNSQQLGDWCCKLDYLSPADS